jgi:hypothetical protein
MMLRSILSPLDFSEQSRENCARRRYHAGMSHSRASEMLETVLGRLQGRDCHAIPVLEHGVLIGLVTMDNVGEFLMIQAAERRM